MHQEVKNHHELSHFESKQGSDPKGKFASTKVRGIEAQQTQEESIDPIVVEEVQQQAGNGDRTDLMPQDKALAQHARGSSDRSNKKDAPAIHSNLRTVINTLQAGRLVSNPDNHEAIDSPNINPREAEAWTRSGTGASLIKNHTPCSQSLRTTTTPPSVQSSTGWAARLGYKACATED